MINKYLNKLNKDFESTDWNPKIQNLGDSPFPEVLADKLEIKPDNATSEYVVFHNRNHRTNNAKTVKFNSNLRPEWLLPLETKKILTLFLQHLLKDNSNEVSKNVIHGVMHVITTSKKQYFEFTQSDYDELISPLIEKSNGKLLNSFIKYCVSHGYCEQIRTRAVTASDDKEAAKRRKEKLPKESSIIALGDIFYEVIPQDRSTWDTSVNRNQTSALMSTFNALCLGSPNRMEAEVITLQKQTLASFDSQDDESNALSLYSLMWQGSKNYKDNENHIGSWMAEPVERALSYFDRVTAPYRVLANFWINQQSTINNLFASVSGQFKKQLEDNEISENEIPDFIQRFDERLKIANLSRDDIPNFIQLGYLLGFYSSDTFMLNIRGKLDHKVMSEEALPVHISDISADLKVFSNPHGGIGRLLGLDDIKKSSAIVKNTDLKIGEFVTIAELQRYQFENMIKGWTSFPYLSLGENQNEVNLCDAMWVLTGAAIGGYGGYYTLINAETIAALIDKQMVKGKLLNQHGFSIRLRVTPHQLRHYINHNGYINDIPEYILNKWSGRADSKHLVHYIHEEEDLLVRIPKVTKQIKINNIQIVDESEREFADQRGLVEGATSRTSVGFCIKDFRYSPCSYLSKFETQCTFCEHSCHVAHDQKGIDVLKEDYAIQQRAINEYSLSPKKNNENRSNWFKTQKANTYLLSQLIDVLEDKSIREGSVVRVITETQDIRIADLKTKTVTFRKLKLDVMDKDIEEGLKLLNFVEEKTNRDKVTDAFLEDLWGEL